MTARNDFLRVACDIYTALATGSSPKIQLFVFWGLIMTRLHDFPYLVKRRLYKVGWLLKKTARIDLLWMFYNMYTPQITGSAPKMPFFPPDLCDEISIKISMKVSISRYKLYIILNWLTFQNDRDTHLSISVYHNT